MTLPDAEGEQARLYPVRPVISARTIELLNHEIDATRSQFDAQLEALQSQLDAHRELFNTQHANLRELLNERYATQTKALDAAFLAQQAAMTTAFSASEKAVQAALFAAEKAVDKANVANEKRFESVNEFRGQLNDMVSTLITRIEADARISALDARLTEAKSTLDSTVASAHSSRTTTAQLWTYLIGAVGIISVAVTIIMATR